MVKQAHQRVHTIQSRKWCESSRDIAEKVWDKPVLLDVLQTWVPVYGFLKGPSVICGVWFVSTVLNLQAWLSAVSTGGCFEHCHMTPGPCCSCESQHKVVRGCVRLYWEAFMGNTLCSFLKTKLTRTFQKEPTKSQHWLFNSGLVWNTKRQKRQQRERPHIFSFENCLNSIITQSYSNMQAPRWI